MRKHANLEVIKSLTHYLFDPRINHFVDVSDQQMKNLMLETDIAILPTSGILFEAIACKARIIFGMYSENQQLLYDLTREAGHGIDAGQFLAKDIYNALDKSFTFSFSSDLLSIDGKSPKRITQLFRDLLITLRHAELKDAETLFKWANDPEVRYNSINKEPIEFQNHLEWYNQKLYSNCTHIFIMEYAGLPVGQVRYDKYKECWLIDYSVAKEYRGLGLGKKLIQQSATLFTNGKLIAKVLHSNTASAKVFQSCEFIFEHTEDITGVKYDIYTLNRI